MLAGLELNGFAGSSGGEVVRCVWEAAVFDSHICFRVDASPSPILQP